MGLGSILGGVGKVVSSVLGGGSSGGGGGSIGSIFGTSGNQKPYDMAQFGPFSNLQEATYNRNEQGAPNYDVLDQYGDAGGVPRRPLMTGQFVPGAPGVEGLPGMFQGNQQLQQPQQPMGQMAQGQIPSMPPQTSGPFSMPQYGSMDKVTHYDSAFDRFHNITAQMQNAGGTPWNNTQTPRWQQAIMYGFTPWQQRMQVEKQALDNQVKYSGMLQNLAQASAADQQGLENNTAAYGRVAGAYNDMNDQPYRHEIMRQQAAHQGSLAGAADAQAQQRQDLTPSMIDRNRGQAAAGFGRGAQGFAQADQTSQLTGPKKALLQQQGNTQISIQDKNYAQTDQIEELTPRKASESESRTKLNDARAANSAKVGGKLTPEEYAARDINKTLQKKITALDKARAMQKRPRPKNKDAREDYDFYVEMIPALEDEVQSLRARIGSAGDDSQPAKTAGAAGAAGGDADWRKYLPNNK